MENMFRKLLLSMQSIHLGTCSVKIYFEKLQKSIENDNHFKRHYSAISFNLNYSFVSRNISLKVTWDIKQILNDIPCECRTHITVYI